MLDFDLNTVVIDGDGIPCVVIGLARDGLGRYHLVKYASGRIKKWHRWYLKGVYIK